MLNINYAELTELIYRSHLTLCLSNCYELNTGKLIYGLLDTFNLRLTLYVL